MRPLLLPALLLLIAPLAACDTADDVAQVNNTTEVKPVLAAAVERVPKSAPAELSKIPSGSYTIDKKHAYISFSYLHKGLSNPVVGFREFDVALELDAKAPQNSTINVMIDAASIDSRVEEFDEHLRGDKLFDVANFPDITFKSNDIRVTGANSLAVTGDLTMKGVTKAVTLTARINKTVIDSRDKLAKIGVSASTTINRSEWNLGYAVPVVGNEVTITIELEMPQVPPTG